MLAVMNGALREAVLAPQLGPAPALIVSGILLSALILITACAALPWLGTHRPVELVLIGFAWLALTLVFEFSFGLWQGKSGRALHEAYTFRDGNIWPIVLVVIVLAPYIAARISG